MSKKGGSRFDGDDKIIDITDYVDNQSEEDLDMGIFTNHFVDIFSKEVIEKQREETRKRFVHFMINFILFTQIAITVALCFIILKIYP